MAREQLVTRTIVTTKARILVTDLINNSVFEEICIIPRTYKDNDAVLKMVKKLYDNDEKVVVKVLATEEIETLYGMTESTFIENAKVLPPRGTKK